MNLKIAISARFLRNSETFFQKNENIGDEYRVINKSKYGRCHSNYSHVNRVSAPIFHE